ncbi:mitogen-activated protein kinase kinase kinase YODA-like [Canna indica]|uniref:mitogen-activated protein kinase kinase kinase n=1 Tax=Canna indica TaxID=4628 RepID=A0AAQ3QLU0_9LILI|nr:mitogen-activated protein kinase kinase kinase YODA-like [Canna indica]
MPAWWKGKSKSKSKSTPSPRTKEPETPRTPRQPATTLLQEEYPVAVARHGSKDKGNSFDEVLGPRKSVDHVLVGSGGAGGGGAGTGFMIGHPLPLPATISSHGVSTGSASASASSISSGSSDETPDLAFYRYSDPINTPRSRNGVRDLQRHEHASEDRQLFSCSPVSEHPDGANAYSHGQASTETIFSRRTANPSPGLRGHPFPTSPVHPSSFGLCPTSPNRWQDNLRSPPHPLPLPPGSPSCSSHSPPSSSSSRSPKSQWKKGKLLGRGTFGHVYLGFNSESGLMCAIKEVKDISDDANSKECLKQLNQEITLLSQLSHPNIVQYYGSELAEETLSVFLEYVSGGSIHKLLQVYGPFGEPLIRNYTAQILSGLAYLHGRNTVHRDIKGANILVDPNGEIKLADFGMAKHITAYTSIRSFKGSPYWMAPEVIMNNSGYDLSVDIWSLGCTIIEMATSKPPWSQFEGVAAIFKIGNSKDIPELPEYFSMEGKEFLKLCLQRDPSARPSAAQLMDHPFVRDQPAIKSAKLNMIKDVPHSPRSITDANQTMSTMEFSSRRSTSPLHDRDYGMRRASGLNSAFPLACKNPSDLPNLRMNMSLPVSPCSSPLRQFRQSNNRSCLPSPPHPAYSAGAANYSPINSTLYPTRPGNNLSSDPWLDINLFKAQSPYGSPRRLSMGL